MEVKYIKKINRVTKIRHLGGERQCRDSKYLVQEHYISTLDRAQTFNLQVSRANARNINLLIFLRWLVTLKCFMSQA